MSEEALCPVGANVDSVAALLGPSLQVKGEISGIEDLVIDGSVEGTVQLAGRKLTVGTTGKVVADVVAAEVVVFGDLKGSVLAKNRVEIKKDASVSADLTTAQIMMEHGAHFKGSIDIEWIREKAAGEPISSQMALSGQGPRYYCEHLDVGAVDGGVTFALLPNGALPSLIPESEAVRLCQNCMDRYKDSLAAA